MKDTKIQIPFFKTRPTKVEINLSNLIHNLNVVKDLVGNQKIMGIVKADAYGHGIVEISKELEKNSIDYLGVAYIEEAILLRKNNIKVPILVLGAVNTWQIEDFLKYDIDFTGSSLEKITEISKKAKQLNKVANIHLKIDTGMGRIGVQWNRVKPFFQEVFGLGNIHISGIFTHFSSAEQDTEYTQLQTKRFEQALKEISRYIDTKNTLIHMASSAAISNQFKDSFKDMVRPGLILYGYSYNKDIQKRLKPVMTFKTVISYFKVLDKNCDISYGRTYTTKKQTRIVTLPVGYADGYVRELSNKAKVYINGKEYPQVGSICMDQCMVNIGSGEAYNGDKVELWGEHIDMWDICNTTNKIPWDILTGVSHRVPRVYTH